MQFPSSPELDFYASWEAATRNYKISGLRLWH